MPVEHWRQFDDYKIGFLEHFLLKPGYIGGAVLKTYHLVAGIITTGWIYIDYPKTRMIRNRMKHLYSISILHDDML